MAKVLFARQAIGMITLPLTLTLFHQIQRMVCAMPAQRYARHSPATVSRTLECITLRRVSMNTSPNPARGRHGMATAPNALASQSAVAVLREGGNAIEAMIAAAATIAVVYPHMNSIGGDGFWLIAKPGDAPRGLEACGAAAEAASIPAYRARNLSSIPFRGGVAANTVAGTISGWKAAHDYSREALGGRLPLTRLLHDAIDYARHGIPVTRSQAQSTKAKREELAGIAGFAETFLPGGAVPPTGSLFRQPRLANTLERLARAGLNDFYHGELAAGMAHELAQVDSPLSLRDLQGHRAV
jgi:gamma-glutamyltranspeptidase/glutathione hydrolase